MKGFSAVVLIIIVGVLVFAGAFGVRYLFKEKPQQPITEDETANWKTYRNNQIGFEFKYPPAEWRLQEKENIPGILPHEFSIDFISETGKDYWPFRLSIYNCTKKSPTDQVVSACSPGFFTQPNYGFKETLINGNKSYFREWMPGAEVPLPLVKEFFILHDNFIYHIEQSKDAEPRGAFIIDKVVATLKLTS